MERRPPSPDTPATASGVPIDTDELKLATTSQLTQVLERYLDCELDETAVERILLDLDRNGYVEWVTVTRSNEYVWDISDAPENLGDAIAEAAVRRLSEALGED